MTSVPTPIPSRTQYVLEEIKRRILTGRLTPGQALVETELAAQFGVSKTPVREALKTLAGTGLVVMSQYEVRDPAALVSAVAWAASPSWDREAGEHREILRLALDGDADGAARALHAHIASFVERAFPGVLDQEGQE